MTSKPSTNNKAAKPSSAAGGAVKKTASQKNSSSTHDIVAKEAYRLWQERGGNAMENWIEAERRLKK